jgi:hypothetical protein
MEIGMNRSSLRTAVTLLLLCLCGFPLLHAQKPDDQDDKDVKAYVLNEQKFQTLTATYADVAVCRKQNRAAWDQMISDPSYADAALLPKAKMLDTKVPQCSAAIKKHGLDTHEYFVTIETLNRATSVVMMKKRGMTIPAAKAAEAVSTESLSFVESHYEEIEKWRLSIAAQAKEGIN